MKLGIYGGTFDPVHLGHLILAETVREQLSLDEVWFVPAFQNPHKLGKATTPPKARMEMLRFAISGNPRFRLCDMEIKRKGHSYTFETLQAIQELHPDAEKHLLIGADSLTDFPNWREPGTILSLAKLVAVNRGQSSVEVPEQLDPSQVCLLEMPAIDISATQIRNRCEAGKSIRYLTPRSVELYISANQLYETSFSESETT
ncbi:nicotinate-nucleotide adenylyltransferase [Thalassoglobus sp.]|uniref:nicotinate-nucleotide adenylyltransferase n=1 Tax=Thalassoglobus sp. TaxID=2795869 RepID=UPI003AA8561F